MLKNILYVMLTMFLGGYLHAGWAQQQLSPPLIKHDMRIKLVPAQHKIEVNTTITLPPSMPNSLTFSLNSALQLKQTPFVTAANAESSSNEKQYRVTLPSGERQLHLRYEGEVYFPLQQQAEELRDVQETQGTISDQGIYLDSASLWFPRFADEQLVFEMQIDMPTAWKVVTQGEKLRASDDGRTSNSLWKETAPQEDIYLIAGQFSEFSELNNGVALQAFLRTADSTLAKRYIKAAADYLVAYQHALGPYPYKKFALIENFWETGYGMPSFTLLGPTVIRLPFILFGSYPHELLHNWWGNGVYVDVNLGNWSEGLTSYLADHLIQEQRGEGSQYRLEILQKYRDFVDTEKELPLTSFRMRTSQATEAIGYGKVMMFFHALRLQLGDQQFLDALKLFYRSNLFRRASFEDIQKAFEESARKNLTTEFQQALARVGAPELRVSNATAKAAGGGYMLEFQLEQSQAGSPFRIFVPIAITLRDSLQAYQTIVPFFDKQLTVKLPLEKLPLRIDVDAEFDVFRYLDKQELPVALSQLFGAEHVAIVLPSQAPKALLDAYETFARNWAASYPGELQILLDNKVTDISKYGAVWLFGWENRYLNDFSKLAQSNGITIAPQSGVQFGERAYTKSPFSFVLTARNAESGQTLGWVATTQNKAVPGLARKLPHYSKYGYLIFEGNEPTNVQKGSWAIQNSPLSIPVSHGNGTVIEVPRGKMVARPPLFPLLLQSQ